MLSWRTKRVNFFKDLRESTSLNSLPQAAAIILMPWEVGNLALSTGHALLCPLLYLAYCEQAIFCVCLFNHCKSTCIFCQWLLFSVNHFYTDDTYIVITFILQMRKQTGFNDLCKVIHRISEVVKTRIWVFKPLLF